MPRVARVSTAQTLAEKMTPNTNSGRSFGERNAGARFIEGGSRKGCAERNRAQTPRETPPTTTADVAGALRTTLWRRPLHLRALAKLGVAGDVTRRCERS